MAGYLLVLDLFIQIPPVNSLLREHYVYTCSSAHGARSTIGMNLPLPSISNPFSLFRVNRQGNLLIPVQGTSSLSNVSVPFNGLFPNFY